MLVRPSRPLRLLIRIARSFLSSHVSLIRGSYLTSIEIQYLLVGVAEVISPDIHQLVGDRVIQESITRNVGAKLETRERQ